MHKSDKNQRRKLFLNISFTLFQTLGDWANLNSVFHWRWNTKTFSVIWAFSFWWCWTTIKDTKSCSWLGIGPKDHFICRGLKSYATSLFVNDSIKMFQNFYIEFQFSCNFPTKAINFQYFSNFVYHAISNSWKNINI